MKTIFVSKDQYQKEGLTAWEKVVQPLLADAPKQKVWCFYGDLGAGKTTCIQAFCHLLGVRQVVNSPTFAIVNQYITPEGRPIYHMDCYRLRSLHEAVDIGCEDYLNGSNYCFVEWPHRVERLLPTTHVKLKLVHQEKGCKIDYRLITE